MLGPKYLRSTKIWVEKNFGSSKKSGSNKNFGEKNVQTKLGLHKCPDQIIIGPKKYLLKENYGQEKNVGSEKCLV